jgi:death on curing protein
VKEPRWLTRDIVVALHDESLAQFGGPEGLRDEALLESALARPRQRFAYGAKPSLAELAAAYGYGIIRNHPFVDGNKRTGLLCVAVFLHINGLELCPDEVDEVRIILALATGELPEADFSAWIADNARERS